MELQKAVLTRGPDFGSQEQKRSNDMAVFLEST